MKDLNQFYNENITLISELEDTIFGLICDMENECGKQSVLNEKLNKSWTALYEIREETGDVKRVKDSLASKANKLKGSF